MLALLDLFTGAWAGLAEWAAALAAEDDLAVLQTVLVTGLLRAVAGASAQAIVDLSRMARRQAGMARWSTSWRRGPPGLG